MDKLSYFLHICTNTEVYATKIKCLLVIPSTPHQVFTRIPIWHCVMQSPHLSSFTSIFQSKRERKHCMMNMLLWLLLLSSMVWISI